MHDRHVLPFWSSTEYMCCVLGNSFRLIHTYWRLSVSELVRSSGVCTRLRRNGPASNNWDLMYSPRRLTNSANVTVLFHHRTQYMLNFILLLLGIYKYDTCIVVWVGYWCMIWTSQWSSICEDRRCLTVQSQQVILRVRHSDSNFCTVRKRTKLAWAKVSGIFRDTFYRSTAFCTTANGRME